MPFIGDVGITVSAAAQGDLRAQHLDSIRNQHLCEGYDFQRQRELSELCDLLRRISDHNKAARDRRHNFFAKESTAAPFDQIELRINFVSAVNINVNLRMCFERGQRNSKLLGQLLGRLRGRYSHNLESPANAFCKESQKVCGSLDRR